MTLFSENDCPVLIPFYRYLSERLMDVALDVLNARDTRVLTCPANSQEFRRLNKFFKNVLITVPRVPRQASRKKKIHGLVPHAGKYQFDVNGNVTTVEVHPAVLDVFLGLTAALGTLPGNPQHQAPAS
jgi:hypothetical protein